MSLLNRLNYTQPRCINYHDPVAAKIQQRRYQILVHSLLYYELDMSIVPDHKWSQWAAELVQLQRDNPQVAEKVIFHKCFKEFDGSTGFNLPYTDGQIVDIAYKLLQTQTSAESEQAKLALMQIIRKTPSEWDRYKQNAKAATHSNGKGVTQVGSKHRKGLFSVPRTSNR